jgi:signal transduction histidine kinase
MNEYLMNVESCRIDTPPLLYYSHVSTAIAVLFVALYIFKKKRQSLDGKLLLLIGIFFTLWSVSDIILWMSINVLLISTIWSLINAFEMLVSITTLYFAYVFFEKKDVSSRMKVLGISLFAPYLLLIPSAFNITGFDLINCEATQGPMITWYFRAFEVVVSLWLLSYLAKTIYFSPKGKRSIPVLFSLGTILFLVFFSGTNVIATVTGRWEILHYGLLGVPFFVGFLAYLIVRYQVFNVKVVGAQVLVLVLILLVGAQFFYVKTIANEVLTIITFLLVSVFGWMLMRSIRNEVERKEELQMISDSLASANERLRRLDNAKSEFISIASHQLRTPITAIKGYVSLVLEGSYGKVNAEVQDVLEKVYRVQTQLSQLVEDLLNVSRIEAGRIQYQYAPTRLEMIITDLVDMFSITARDKGIALRMHLSKKALPELTIDANKIKETISNLIDNAVKYTPQGGEVKVILEGDEARRVARVIVEDNGVGISPEDKSRLFEKFVRSKETTQMVTSGTGLGLYVGKNFVEAHGGRIWAESEGSGMGARFIVELPYEHSETGSGEVATFGKSYER